MYLSNVLRSYAYSQQSQNIYTSNYTLLCLRFFKTLLLKKVNSPKVMQNLKCILLRLDSSFYRDPRTSEYKFLNRVKSCTRK